MRKSCGAALASIILLGCAASPRPASPAPVKPPPAPAPPPEPAPSASASASIAEAGPDIAATDAPAAAPEFDFETWCIDHQVKAELSVDRCAPAKIGDKPDDTLWCFRHQDNDDGSALFYQTLYVAKAGRLQRLTEFLIAAQTPALPGHEKEEPIAVRLELKADDAKLLDVGEGSPGCDAALEHARQEFAREGKLRKRAESLIGEVCKTRGKYSWQAGTLRRAR